MSETAAQAKPIRAFTVGMLGCGVVGQGVVKLLARHREDFRRNGFELRLTHVAIKHRDKRREVDLGGVTVLDDPLQVARHANVDFLVEVMGGVDIASEAGCAALARGIPLVSANKAALARRLPLYLGAAEAGGAGIGLESAAAAHIPIFEVLDRSLACEEISLIKGVVNGTTNYILTLMERTGWDFARALQDASDKGFTEADPSLDIDGIDAAEKLTLLAYKTFGAYVAPDRFHVEGIRHVTRADIALSKALNQRIKLIASARRTEQGLVLHVYPALIHTGELLADVDSEFNAIILEGPNFKELTFLGKGAGQLPTASAVVNDLVKQARRVLHGGEAQLPGFVKAADREAALVGTPALSYCYFLRLKILSQGVTDGIVSFLETQNVKVLGRASVSLDGAQWLGLITDVVRETRLSHLLKTLARVDGVLEPPAFIRLDKDNYREIVEQEQRAYFGAGLERQPGAGV
jgi:homoserine dehydrogenase